MQALSNKYADRNVQTLVINVLEDRDRATAWKKKLTWSLPVLLDYDGRVSVSYAPKDMLADLPRSEVPIASNLIIDKDGNIQFYSLLDSRNFDARLVALTARLEELLAAESEDG